LAISSNSEGPPSAAAVPWLNAVLGSNTRVEFVVERMLLTRSDDFDRLRSTPDQVR
jgi:hypothetical protein